ncbi:MAG: hypothetical protein HYY46_11910 [Deltaproteobacteria bacterium]|nr:hypothetical protein [Deltaproteobacteria bacterium]
MANIGEVMVKLGGDARGFGQGIREVHSGLSGLPGLLKQATATMVGFVGAQVGLRAVGFAFESIKGSVIGMNKTLEMSTLQFEVLLGSSEAARKKIASLFEFAAKTPFETGPVIKASKLLQSFGSDALNTDENLRRVGDAAAVAGVEISEIAFWIGRAFGAATAGRPMTDSIRRLQELAVLTPQTAMELEKLTEAGKKGDEVFGLLIGSFDRFKGAMEKMAGTWEGLTSTIKDAWGILTAGAFKPFFDALKDGLNAVAKFGAFVQTMSALGVNFPSIARTASVVTLALSLAVKGLAAGFVTLGLGVWPVVMGLAALSDLTGRTTGGFDKMLGVGEKMSANLETLGKSITADVAALGSQVMGMFGEVMTGPTQQMMTSLTGVSDKIIGIGQSMQTGFADKVQLALQGAGDRLTALGQKATAVGAQVATPVVAELGEVRKVVSENGAILLTNLTDAGLAAQKVATGLEQAAVETQEISAGVGSAAANVKDFVDKGAGIGVMISAATGQVWTLNGALAETKSMVEAIQSKLPLNFAGAK